MWSIRPAYHSSKAWVSTKLSNFWRRAVLVLIPFGVAVLVVTLLALIFWGPERHVEYLGISRGSENFAELANMYRATYAQILGGVLFLSGLYFAWERLEVARKSQDIDRRNQLINQEGQITERFTRAIDQLGNKSLVIRLGGIYALERIARDSEKDHWTVMEVLTAYVREHSSRKKEPVNEIQTDIQAALTVVGQRKWIEKEICKLNFTRTNLRKVDLIEAHLKGANFSESLLEGANLSEAHLEEANLSRIRLEGANLSSAHLERVTLIDAHLERAILYLTHLEGTPLYHTHLERANLYQTHLEGADLRWAQGLTREQIEMAITDEETKLPKHFQNPPEKEEK